MELINFGKSIFDEEVKALIEVRDVLDDGFAQAIETISQCLGKIVVTGVGKSGIVGQKIVATLNSTGTQAVFLHASDAIHGDLGIIRGGDVILAISKSGNSDELINLILSVRQMGNLVIGMVSDKNSFLAKNSDILLWTPISKEADPNNLAPTSSTTVQMVMGDAIAIALVKIKSFTPDQFALLHPGGTLGKKLLMTVGYLCDKNPHPNVPIDATIQEIIYSISSGRLGATAVLHDSRVVGIITDGDIRRMLGANNSIDQKLAKDIMSPNPISIDRETLASHALKLMEDKMVTQLIVLKNNDFNGIIHLHDLVKEGMK